MSAGAGLQAEASLGDPVLDQLFRNARSRNRWQDRPLPPETPRRLYELLKWGPTAFNGSPGRFAFVISSEAKERLLKHVSSGNQEKVRGAPCTVIVASDIRFHEHLPHLWPARDLQPMFVDNAEMIAVTTQRNSSLQGAYLIMAARALGLDAGPMSGFNNAGVDAEFFPDGRWRSNFLCAIGYGTGESLPPRGARLDFEQACVEL